MRRPGQSTLRLPSDPMSLPHQTLIEPKFRERGFLTEQDPLTAFPSNSEFSVLDQVGRDLVPIQNLNPDVLMVDTAEDWYRCDAAELLRPAKIRSIFIQ